MASGAKDKRGQRRSAGNSASSGSWQAWQGSSDKGEDKWEDKWGNDWHSNDWQSWKDSDRSRGQAKPFPPPGPPPGLEPPKAPTILDPSAIPPPPTRPPPDGPRFPQSRPQQLYDLEHFRNLALYTHYKEHNVALKYVRMHCEIGCLTF